ncbi:MAG: CBS domain-containing protein [Gammaproteobacteria bacterium]
MKIQLILDKKGTDVQTIAPDASLVDMVQKMLSRHIGSLLVLNEDGSIHGIVTERDLLRTIARNPDGWNSLHIGDVMSTDVLTADIGDTLEQVMVRMTSNRIRHIPILNEGKLAGVLSMGDIVNAALEQTSFQNELLKRYISNWPDEEEAEPSKH